MHTCICAFLLLHQHATMESHNSDHTLFPGTKFTITKEQFNAFHSIDRALYSRLVLTLGRDPVESMQVMALWLWLERHSGRGRNLVYKLLSFPSTFVNMLVEECVTCINCIENDFVTRSDDNDIPMLHGVLGGGINLNFFCENRVSVVLGMSKIMIDVCVKAFDDILSVHFAAVNAGGGAAAVGGGGKGVAQSAALIPHYYPNGSVVRGGYSVAGPSHVAGGMESMYGYEPGGVMQRGFMDGGDEIGELLERVSLREGVPVSDADQEREVGPDERAIFLTFSKGYPTSEFEIRDFFTRKFGDIIEVIHMQEVQAPEEQVLYARLVVRSAGVVYVVLEGKRKAKFTINGKHVWARKYVKNTTTTTAAASPRSRRLSP